MRVFIALLILLTLYMQYALWFQRGGRDDVETLRQSVLEQRAEIQQLRERNQALAAEVLDLKQGLEAIEERARSDMGMVKENEIFFRMTQPQTQTKPDTHE